MHLMCADDRHQAVAHEKVAHGLKRVIVGAAALVSLQKALRVTSIVKLPDRMRPQ